jgi:hypothetical protein
MDRLRRGGAPGSAPGSAPAKAVVKTEITQTTPNDLYPLVVALVEQNQTLSGLMQQMIDQQRMAMEFMQRAMGIEVDTVEASAVGPGDDEGDDEEPAEPAEPIEEKPTEPDVKVPDEIEAPAEG